MTGIITALNLIGKGVSVAHAVVNIHELSQKEKWTTADKADLAMQTLFAAAQVGSMGCTHFSNAAANLKLAANISAGVLDVGRTVSNKLAHKESMDVDDALDILGVLAFRAGDVGLSSLNTHSEVLGDMKPTVENFAKISSTVPVIIKSGQIIRNWMSPQQTPQVQQPVVAQPQQYVPQFPYQQAAAQAQQKNGFAQQLGTPQQPVQNNPLNQTPPRLRQWIQQKNKHFQNKILQTISGGIIIQGRIVRLSELDAKEKSDSAVEKLFKAVVSEFDNLPRCKISKEPITSCLVPNYDTDDPSMIFDHSSVEKWLKESSNQAPQGWERDKVSLPMRMNHFARCPALQKFIDQAWEPVLKEFFKRLAAGNIPNSG